MYALFLALAAASLLIAPCLVALLPGQRRSAEADLDSEAGIFV